MSTHEHAAPPPTDGCLELGAALEQGAVVLCASPVLAHHLRQSHALTQASSGERVWRTPDILTWQAWLRQQFERLLDAGVITQTLLNNTQEQLLWREVIAESAEGQLLLRVDGAARSAARAFRLAARYRLGMPAHAKTAETELYLRWRERFEHRLRTGKYSAAATLEDLLADALGNATLATRLRPPGTIALCGFPECPPVQLDLLARLKVAGTRLLLLEHARTTDGEVRCQVAPDADEEVRLAVRFAIAHHAHDEGRQIVIATVDDHQQHRPLERALTNAVDAGQLADFQFEPPATLASNSAIGDALLWLELAVSRVTVATVRQLLNSPMLAAASDPPATRARHLAVVGNSRRRYFNLTELAKLLEANETTTAGAQLAALRHLADKLRDTPRTASLQTWSRLFADWLKAAGWPGRAANVNDLRERFRETLGLLAKLSAVHEECSAGAALQQLRELTAATAAETARDVPVRIVNVADAAFMRVDAMWVLGMTDDAWPPASKAHPMLPYAEQRRARAAGATPALALAQAEALTARLRHAASEVVFSFPQQSEDRALRASPLLADLPAQPAVRCAEDAQRIGLEPLALEHVADWRGPPLDTSQPVRGGTRLIADQSECPFQAFVTHRLHVRPLEPGDVGIERRDAGTLLHAALEHAWTELKTSSALAALEPDARGALAGRASRRAIESLAERIPALASAPYASLEMTRLAELVEQWLIFETQRKEAFEVVVQEAGADVTIGPLTLRTRADRIDRLANGEFAIIDYKTGDVSLAGWNHERLREPQVPIYATHANEHPAAALVAQVRAGKMRFLGRASRAGVAPGLRAEHTSAEDWSTTLDTWRDSLAMLASEAADGIATMTPAQHAALCNTSDLITACRREAVTADDDVSDA